MHFVYYQKSSRIARLGILLWIVMPVAMVSALGQTFRGRVEDGETGEGLPYATVAAQSLPDSTLLGGVITDADGTFSITLEDAPERMVFRISMLGYKTMIVPSTQIETIRMRPLTTELNEVVVSAPRSTAIQMKGRALVCNVAGTPLAGETQTMDLLGKLPGFYLHGGELRSLAKGRVAYFIDDRPRSSDEVMRLSVRDIDRVEIDHHPGARFGGEVGTVVLVFTRRGRREFSGFIRSYTRANHKLSQGVDGEFRLNWKDWRLTLGADYTVFRSATQQDNAFSSESLYIRSRDKKLSNRTDSRSYFVDLGYDLTKDHQISLRYTHEPTESDILSHGLLAVGEEESPFDYDVKSKETSDMLSLFYSGTFTDSWRAILSGDYYHQHSSTDQTLTESDREVLIGSRNNGSIWGVAPRLLYSRGSLKGEIGGDVTQSRLHSVTQLDIDDVAQVDNRIDELKAAAYLEGSWQPSDTWQLYGGLRYETISRHIDPGKVQGSPDRFTFTTLLPSLSLSLTTGSVQHRLSYDAHLEYPTFDQLSGGDLYINRYNYRTSNAFLRQSTIHRFSYDLSYRWIYLSAGYSYTLDGITDVFELDHTHTYDRIQVSPQNLRPTHGITAFVNVAPRFGIYQPRLMAGYVQNILFLPDPSTQTTRRVSKPFCVLSWNNSLSLPHRWFLDVDFSYNGSGTNGYMDFSSTSSLDISVRKSFFKDRLKLSLRGSDLLDRSTPDITGSIGGITLHNSSYRDSRNVRLILIWYFNKYESQPTHSSVSTEIDRM